MLIFPSTLHLSNVYVYIIISFLILFTSFPPIITGEEKGALPQPFDTTLFYKLSDSCLSFFKNFLKDDGFIECNSFGFLLSSSNEFAFISRNPDQIPTLLDTICSPKR